MKHLALLGALLAAMPVVRAQDRVVRADRPPSAEATAADPGASHRDAIRSNPADPAPYFRLARMAQEAKRYDEALAWIREVKRTTKDPGASARSEVEEMLLVDSLRKHRETNPESDARTAARAAMVAGVKLAREPDRRAEAEAKLTEALKLDPTFAEPLFNLAVLADQHGDVTGAIRRYQEYIVAAPTMPHALTAEARIAQLNPAPAETAAPAASSDRYRRSLELASTAIEAGKREEAITHLGSALQSATPEQRPKLEQLIQSLRSSATSTETPEPRVGSAEAAAGRPPPSNPSAKPAKSTTAMQREPCSTCHGSGTCTSCGGKKGEAESCRICNGTGEAVGESCIPCSGTGRADCATCRASGSVSERCGPCVNGKIDCEGCDGTGGRAPCSHCGGSGTKTCGLCNGAGEVHGVSCPHCKTTGEMECVICKGTGKEDKCFTCDGTGREKCVKCSGTGMTSERCTACSGSAKSTCLQCAGKGRSTTRCTSCKGGQKFEPCSTCDQTGRCTSCSGQGFRMVEVRR